MSFYLYCWLKEWQYYNTEQRNVHGQYLQFFTINVFSSCANVLSSARIPNTHPTPPKVINAFVIILLWWRRVPFHPPFNDSQTSVGRAVPESSGEPRLVVPALLIGRQYRYDGVHDDALVVHCTLPRYEICHADVTLQRTCTTTIGDWWMGDWGGGGEEVTYQTTIWACDIKILAKSGRGRRWPSATLPKTRVGGRLYRTRAVAAAASVGKARGERDSRLQRRHGQTAPTSV